MTKSVLCILIAILVYMAMMVVIGVIYSKKNSSVGDFYLGGRRLGPIVSAMSAEAVAEAHFGKHAYQLTKSEAALIAATLPNPRKFNSAKPSPYMLKRQAKIISLMGKLIKVEMGYGAGQVDPGTGKVKKRKKWRASVIMTWDESLMPMR